jgi:hypothetical protein
MHNSHLDTAHLLGAFGYIFSVHFCRACIYIEKKNILWMINNDCQLILVVFIKLLYKFLKF